MVPSLGGPGLMCCLHPCERRFASSWYLRVGQSELPCNYWYFQGAVSKCAGKNAVLHEALLVIIVVCLCKAIFYCKEYEIDAQCL